MSNHVTTRSLSSSYGSVNHPTSKKRSLRRVRRAYRTLRSYSGRRSSLRRKRSNYYWALLMRISSSSRFWRPTYLNSFNWSDRTERKSGGDLYRSFIADVRRSWRATVPFQDKGRTSSCSHFSATTAFSKSTHSCDSRILLNTLSIYNYLGDDRDLNAKSTCDWL